MTSVRRLRIFALATLLAGSAAGGAQADVMKELVPTGTLRVAIAYGPTPSALYALKDPATGKFRGVTIMLGTALAKKLGVPVEFMPHVAPHFRGLTVTTNLYLSRALKRDEVLARFQDAYGDEVLVRIVDDPPWVSRIAGRHHAEIGGFALSADGRRVVIVATLDNLLKGAATQAMQNINMALGIDEFTGITM